MATALGGALIRDEHGDYYWSDGTHEPRVRSMRLRDIAPNPRCTTIEGVTYVEVPRRWYLSQYWPNARVDDDAAAKIRELTAGRPTAQIYADGMAEAYDNHQLVKSGYLVPVNEWDIALSDVCGVWWDTEHEASIKAKAGSLGWRA